MTWGAVIGAVASLGAGVMAKNSADSSLNAQQRAARRLGDTRFNPFTVNGPGGMGFSSVSGVRGGGEATFDLGQFQGLFDQFRGGAEQNLFRGQQFQNLANLSIPGQMQGMAQAGMLGQGSFDQAQNLQQNGFQRGLQNSLFAGAQQSADRLGVGFDEFQANTLSTLRERAGIQNTRAFQGLQETQFGQGISGSSGGALQTEAFARGLGQSDLDLQLASSGEARNQQNQLQSLFGMQMGGAQGLAGLEDNLMNNAFSRFGNMQNLTADLSNNIFNRGSTLFNQGGQSLGGAQSIMGMLMNLGNFGANLGAQHSNTRLGALGGQSNAIANFGASGNDIMAGFLSSLGDNIFSGDSTPFASTNANPVTVNSGFNSSAGMGGQQGGGNPFAGLFPGMQ